MSKLVERIKAAVQEVELGHAEYRPEYRDVVALLAHIERLESAVQAVQAVKDWDIENFKERGAFLVPQEIRQMIQAATHGEGKRDE